VTSVSPKMGKIFNSKAEKTPSEVFSALKGEEKKVL